MNKFTQQHLVTGLAGVFALVSVQNVSHFFIELGHPTIASWTLGIAIGTALVILAHLLSEIDMRERRAFAGLLVVTLILVCLSGVIQGIEYSHRLGGMGYLLAFTLAATGEIVLPLAHSWHNEARRRQIVNDAGQRVEEIAAQTLVDTMSGVDVTRAQRQAERRIEQLVIAHVDSIVQKLTPATNNASFNPDDGGDVHLNVSVSNTPKLNDLDSSLERMNASRSNAKNDAIERLLDYYRANPNASLNDAGHAIGRSKSTIKNYLDELQASNRVHVNGSVQVIG